MTLFQVLTVCLPWLNCFQKAIKTKPEAGNISLKCNKNSSET